MTAQPSDQDVPTTDEPMTTRALRRLGAVAAATVVGATTVVALGATTAPASAAENDYQSDPDCQNGNGSIPADIVTRAVDGWRFSASCNVSYLGAPESQVPASSSSWDAVFVSDQDIQRTAHVKFFCPAPTGPGQTDQGTLRGIAADGSEVFRLAPTRSDHSNTINYIPGRCHDDN